MKKIESFFWYCSGAHPDLLRECPSESSKYVGIGATIFFTGLFAAFAAGYALFTVFDNYWIAGALGFLWGLMIFNLDRYIVSSMRKEGNTKKELLTALPRLVLAILISIVIVKPLELKIFEKEIDAELILMEQQTYALQETEIRARFEQDRTTAMKEIERLKQEIQEKEVNRDNLVRAAQEEADGTGGTKIRNAGPIYKIKKADADRAEQELKDLRSINERTISEKWATVSTIDSTLTATIANLERKRMDGPAARMEALNRLTKNSMAIWMANLFIMLLFIAIETAPVLVKLIAGRGPYDHMLKVLEHTYDSRRVEDIGKLHTEIKARSEALSKKEKDFINSQLDLKLDEMI